MAEEREKWDHKNANDEPEVEENDVEAHSFGNDSEREKFGHKDGAPDERGKLS